MVGRFAPSPSGRMHLGNIFAALIAWLSVRAQGGRMVLRIEDLDPDRSKEEYVTAIRDDLHWLGLNWDVEMPRQSTRSHIYAQYFARLQPLTYPCYCSRSELHDASAPHASDGRIIYGGTCRNLTAEERAQKTREPAWRIRVPEDTIAFHDGICGYYAEQLALDCGDFILRRSDGVYAYQLAVVCDDALGGITEVVRGQDLLSSTPRQLWLYRMLELTPPHYFHIPLLITPDGRRLSKREHDLDMEHLRNRFGPEELIGKLAFLAGLQPEEHPISAAELVSVFTWESVRRENICINPSIF